MNDVGDLLDRSGVVVCCGPGGVGKTSVAASMAHAAACRGRRAVVVTIDPARRLADAIGLGGGLANEPARVDLDAPGEMWASMLDVRETFDHLVSICAPTPAQAETIRGNRFYVNIGGSLSGTRDYMAAERLLALHNDPRFDLVIVDTPPSRNALDFLEAPERLARFLDHRLYRLLVAPTRGGFRIVSTALQPVVRLIGKVVGSDALSDVIEFLRAFDGMDDGFRRRARETAGLLRSEASSFVLVTSPRPEAMLEADYFAGQLGRLGIGVGAVVANRMPPRFGPTTAATAERNAREATDAAERWLWSNLAELHRDADRAEASLARFVESIGSTGPALVVPELATDIHDFDGITMISSAIAPTAGRR